MEEAALGIHSEPAARPSLHLCGCGVTLTMLRANRKALSFTDGQTLSQDRRMGRECSEKANLGPGQDCDTGQCPMENMKNPQIFFFFKLEGKVLEA